jgi:isoleucyl-tRNA synthetase
MPDVYDHKEMQEKWNKYWDKLGLVAKLEKKNAKGPKFYYLDGPPYANAPPHIGHALTRTIRECFLKYKQMQGHSVWLQPGFDCHGLPVEFMVEKELGSKSRADIERIGIEKFNKLCREHATKYLKMWSDFYKQFGSTSIWSMDNPYLTLNQDYIDSSWLFFKKAAEKELIYQGKATTAWCPRCETALSGYEVTQDYKEIEDTSIFIKFPVKGMDRTYFLVWTTTPWTLPGNSGIAVNAAYEYAFVKAGDDTYILAKELVEKTMATLDVKVYEIKDTKKGDELTKLEYTHPLEDEVPVHRGFAHRVITADFVLLEEGTGCVHTAPGHGPEDYTAGLKWKLPVLSPVNEKGMMTEGAGKYSGKFVFKANPEIIEDLEKHGALAKLDKLTHRYAHCWRCKSKLIYRASDQWFIAVEPIKQKMLEENAKVRWVPSWAGQERFHNWVMNARDWCISRSRFWGTPLPIWVCKKCGAKMIMGSYAELKEKAGLKKDVDLHRPYIDEIKLKCDCGGEAVRVPEITDVWFDSGAASWASLGYPKDKKFEKLFPIDFISEGIDQTRGWFYHLLVESTVVFGRAPYASVLVNGLMLDDKGEKMSKSKGNVVDPFDAISKYGADAIRWYLLYSVAPWEDTCFSLEDLKTMNGAVNTFWNVCQFAKKFYELDKWKPGKKPKKLAPEDEWILSRAEGLLKKVGDAYDSLNPNIAARSLRDFIIDDLSRDYIKFVRARLKEGKKEDKEAVYYTLHSVMQRLCPMAATIMPFISEEAYQGLVKDKESVHLEEWPCYDEKKRDLKLEDWVSAAKRVIEAASNLRNQAGIRLRQPLKELYVVSEDPQVEEAVDELEGIISDQTNVKKISFSKKGPEGDYLTLMIEGGAVFLDKTIDEKLLKEGMTREVVRRIQQLRKDMKLVEKDEITVNIVADKEFTKLLDGKRIGKQTNTRKLMLGAKKELEGTEKDWSIEDYKVKLVVKKC